MGAPAVRLGHQLVCLEGELLALLLTASEPTPPPSAAASGRLSLYVKGKEYCPALAEELGFSRTSCSSGYVHLLTMNGHRSLQPPFSVMTSTYQHRY